MRQQVGPGSTNKSDDGTTRDYVNELPSYGQLLNLIQRYDGRRGIHNYRGSNTRRMDHGFGNAQGGGETVHAWLGDSLSDGCNSGVGTNFYFDHLNTIPFGFANQLSGAGIPRTGTTCRFVSGPSAQAIDPRMVYAGTWSGFNSCTVTNTVNSTTTFSPEVGADGTFLRLGYFAGASGGTFTISLDGTVIATISPGLSTTWQEARVNLSAAANQVIGGRSKIVVKLTVAAGAAGIAFSYIETWTPNGGIRMLNFAQSAAKAHGTGNQAWEDFSTTSLDNLGRVYVNAGERTRQVTDATSTAGSATLGSTSGAFTAADEGKPMDQTPGTSGLMFPPNTYFKTFVNSTTFTMSANATNTTSAQTINIGRDPDCVHIALGLNDLQVPYTAAQIATAYQNIKAQFPNSTIIYHLVHEITTALVSSANMTLFQQTLMQQCETDGVPLYDWRDRVGTFSQGQASGDYGDNQAHLKPGIYLNLGSSLSTIIGPGAGRQQNRSVPIYPNDLTNKLYVDDIQRYNNQPTIADGSTLSGTAETIEEKITIPANFWTTTKTIRGVTSAVLTATVGTITVVGRLREGTAGTTSDTTLVANGATPGIATAANVLIEFEVSCRAVGSSGTVAALIKVTGDNVAPRVAVATATVNTTVETILSLAITLAGTSPTYIRKTFEVATVTR